MPDDDALARALAEQARRSKVMADAQRFGPPHHPEEVDTDQGAPTPKATRGPWEARRRATTTSGARPDHQLPENDS